MGVPFGVEWAKGFVNHLKVHENKAVEAREIRQLLQDHRRRPMQKQKLGKEARLTIKALDRRTKATKELAKAIETLTEVLSRCAFVAPKGTQERNNHE